MSTPAQPPYPGDPAAIPPVPQPIAAQPPKKNKTLKIVLIVIGALVLLCSGGAVACTAIFAKAGSDVANEIDKEMNAEKTDIKITDCKVRDDEVLPGVDVSWTVTNSSDHKRSYLPMFAVNAEDGTRLGENADLVSDLAAGQTSKKTTTVLLDKPATGKVTCILTDAVK